MWRKCQINGKYRQNNHIKRQKYYTGTAKEEDKYFGFIPGRRFVIMKTENHNGKEFTEEYAVWI